MPPETEETVDDTTATDADSADETATNASPVDDASSSAESAPEEELDDSPEAVAEREKQARKNARVATAEAAEKKAAADRAKRLREREDRDREAQLIARETQAAETMRQAKAALEEIADLKAKVLKGGFDGLKALGIEYGDWTKRTLEETSPDAVAQRALQEAREAREELKRRDARDAQAQARAEAEAGAKKFEAFAESNADDFPDASLLPSSLFRQFADDEAARFMRETGRPPTFDALLPRLDRRAKDFHDEQKQRGEKRSRPATTPSDGATTPQAIPGQSASKPINRTLTPAIAGTRATPPREMTEEEKDEWARQELRAALAADRKAARSA